MTKPPSALFLVREQEEDWPEEVLGKARSDLSCHADGTCCVSPLLHEVRFVAALPVFC